jgi:hypothetical protein
MKKPAKNKVKKSILLKALSGNLDKMSKSPLVRSLKDGKDLVCPFCELPVKPCASNSSAMCESMLLAGTEGKVITEALNDPSSTRFGTCLSCGKQISTTHLRKHPTADLCMQCIRKGRKILTNKIAHA